VAEAHLSALAVGGGGRGAAVGRDFADRQRFAAVLDGNGGLEDVHACGLRGCRPFVNGEARGRPREGRPHAAD
jgi:hypothetical protein